MLIDGISRQQARLMAIAALVNANTLAGPRVFGWADWPTRPEMFPLLLVSAPRERKVSIYPGTLQFNTTFSVVVVGRLVAATPGPVGTGLEALSEQVTDAICLDPALGAQVQQFNVVETQTAVSAEGGQHIGEISMTFDLVVYQDYSPAGEPLTDISSVNAPADGGPEILTDIQFLSP